ncbi:ATPase [Thioalkalivibrio sp.]|uniref:ATPase n=1 Tax=Thioalkalivibrio sp. TaxID=2093813 RepID=UPI0012D61198|nr:ATPase [Thioalkalivibrio sp.]TVP82231.1 MAG: ATPase [Thioalkalivibrio sp.]
MSPSPLAEEAVRLLQPLIGIRGRHAGQTLELVEVLEDGPMVALLDASASPRIQTNQFGDPLTRQARILTIPVLSEIEPDAHPVLRSLLPEAVLKELRALIRAHGNEAAPPP